MSSSISRHLFIQEGSSNQVSLYVTFVHKKSQTFDELDAKLTDDLSEVSFISKKFQKVKQFFKRPVQRQTSILTKLTINETPGSGLPSCGRSWWKTIHLELALKQNAVVAFIVSLFSVRPFLQYMKAIRLTRLQSLVYSDICIQQYMNISGDRLSLAAETLLKRRLNKLCQKLPQKATLGLGEPIINSRILSEGFYLSQHLNITTKVYYNMVVYHFCKNDKYIFACILQYCTMLENDSKSRIFFNSIMTKSQHFHEFFTKIFFGNFSREIKVVNS